MSQEALTETQPQQPVDNNTQVEQTEVPAEEQVGQEGKYML
jgi:hypothetical protein